MLTKIKLALVGLLAFASAVFYALLQKEKKERAEDAINAEQKAASIKQKATDALIEGQHKEQQARNNTVADLERFK